MTTFLVVKNSSYSSLASNVALADAAITVIDGTQFPASFNFHITIDAEIMTVTGKVGNVLTVTRAAEGTIATIHWAGAKVSLNVTAKHIQDLNIAVNALETAQYTDADAVAAMGVRANDNPLHHDRAAEWGATEHTAIGNGVPHHVRYTDGEAQTVADAQVAIHAALDTGVHGDGASNLETVTGSQGKVNTHAGIADAHHTRYTDAEAAAVVASSPTGRGATYVIAAHDAPAHVKAQADVVCSGTNDQEDIITVLLLLIAAGGGTLTFTEGSFNVQIHAAYGDDVCIHLDTASNIIIQGQGAATRIVTTDGADIISGADCSHITIRDLYLRGNGIFAATRNGIDFDDSSYVTIKDVTLEDTSDNSIIFHGNGDGTVDSYGHKILNCTIINSKYHGIALANTYYTLIEGNLIVTPAQTGIVTESMTYLDPHPYMNIISQNVIQNPSRNGIRSSYAQYTIIVRNQIFDCNAAIYCEFTADYAYIAGNNIDTTIYEGIVVDGDNCKIVDNTLLNVAADKKGIRCLAGNDGYYVAGNYIQGAQDGIAVYGASLGMRIIGNRSEGAARYGILSYNVENGIITHNDITNSGSTPIDCNKVSCIVRHNQGWKTENSGSSTGTGAQQTIAHGLSITPTKAKIILWSIDSGANPAHSANPDATNIYVTAVNEKIWGWATTP